jgi:hypothetical protein
VEKVFIMLSSGESDAEDESDHRKEHFPRKFTESLIDEYERLVQDLSRELQECRDYIKVHVDSNEDDSCRTIPLHSSAEGDDRLLLLQTELSRKDAIIDNLKQQLGISQNACSINKKLWQFCLDQVEVLETQKKVENNSISLSLPSQVPSGYLSQQCQQQAYKDQLSSSLPTDFLTKWKLLQTYAESLETRLAKSVNEKNFYRNKIMDVKLEYETALKRQVVDKNQEIDHTKASYAKEIEYLKSSIEKTKQQSHTAWEKRLEAEKEAWEYKEHKKLQSIKIQIEQLIIENELLRQKEIHLMSTIKSFKAQMGYDSNDSFHPKNVSSTKEMVSTHVQCDSSIPISNSYTRKFKSVQTDFDVVRPEQLLRMQTSQHQLEMEYTKIRLKLEVTEGTSQDMNKRLQDRIQQLESLNIHLHDQIRDLSDSNAKLLCQTRPILTSYFPNASSSICAQQGPPPSGPLIGLNLTKEAPSWKDHDESIMREKLKVDESRWKLKLAALDKEIRKLREERVQLLTVVERQQSIANRWKAEFKELAQRSIS